jgi:hypothetical protein
VKDSAGIAARLAEHAPTIAVAVVVVALALDSGGYGGVALGLAAAATWIGIVVLSLGPGRERLIDRAFLVAAAALVVLAVLGALGLGWSIDVGTGFEDVVRLSLYLGIFVLAGLLLRPGSGRSVLIGIGAGLAVVSLIALASRLLGLGAGDSELVAANPSFAGRLSFPIGYWNALGSMAAMAVPVLIWIELDIRARAAPRLALAAIPPVVLTAYMTSSRGALIAAAIGATVVVAAAGSRPRAIAALVAGVLAALPAVIVAGLASGILDSPGGSPGRSEAAVGVALAMGMILAAAAGPAFVARAGAIRIPGLRMRHVLAALAAALVALVLIAGPDRIAGDFATTSGREATAGGAHLSLAGSGRAQFWSAALEAFADEPLHGIGTGSYALYWNRHGSLETPVQNAHSEPLELLAELGIVGLAAFVAFFAAAAVAGFRRARRPGGSGAGAALGLIATGVVGIVIDWTWDVPSVAVCVLFAVAVLTTRALDDAGSTPPSPRAAPLAPPAPLVAIVAAALAIPAIWAGAVLAVASDRLDASDDALAVGRLDEAATAARSAAAAEPWSAEPWLQLATVEQAADNLEAARIDARRAIELTPEDFRPWLLATTIETTLRNYTQAFAYGSRTVALAPLILRRASIDPSFRLGTGS